MRIRLTGLLLFAAAASFMSSDLYAQNLPAKRVELKGVVLDKQGNPVTGATIMIKNTTNGTLAKADGSFEISAAPGDTLIVGCIGFKPLKLAHSGQPMLKLVLQEDMANLEQVTVVGYGNVKKKNITGSIASVSAKDISRSSAISFDNAIAGRAAGVDVLSSSGVPGSATAITIRGISSLNSDGNQPLIVIDGIPVYGSGAGLNTKTFNPSTTGMIGFGGTTVSDNLTPRNDFEANPLGNLNPSDIESIEVLKDAYATSIYGSRGASGVILVTTKKGSEKNAVVNFRYITGAAQPIGTYSLLNGQQYNQLYTALYQELGTPATFASADNTDWVKAISRTAIVQNADLSLSGGSDKMRYFLSGSYTDQPAYVIHNDYKRYTGRMNFTYMASEKLSAGANISVAYTDNAALNAASIYRQAILKAPNLPVRDANGNYLYSKGTNPYGNMDTNPVADAELNTNFLESTQTLANIYLQYQVLPGLHLKSEFGTDMNNGNAYTRRVKRPSGFGDDAVQSTTNNRKIVTNNTATFVYSDQEKHALDAVVGQSFEKSVESSGSIGGYGFFNDNILSIGSATNRYIQRALKQEWALVSFFSRVNYAYKNKYLAGVTYRVDGSSKFSQNQRYVGFPSISAGWRLSEESFLKSKRWIDDLKLRGSVGFSGNNSPASYYGNQGQYIINSNAMTYAGTPVLSMQQPDNPNLKWERTRSVDLGLDASFMESRITLTVDYYTRRIKDMILSSAIPLYQGWSIQPQNIGDMKNSGIEFTASYNPVRTRNVDWSMRLNISRNQNKLLKLNFDGEEVGLANEAYKYMKEGEPVAQFFLYDWQGIDVYTGDPIWGGSNGTSSSIPPGSLFTQVDDVNQFRKIFGSSLPQAFGGFSNTVRYKNLELDAFCSFSIGGKMINGSRATLLTYATEDANNLSTEILNYWQVAGQDTQIPRLANRSITASPGSAGGVRDFTTSRTNSRFLENASYLRLRTVNLSYQVDNVYLKRVSKNAIKNLQVFVRGTNLLTWTSYTGVDPEVNAFGSSAIRSGYDELTMPQNKMYQLGINIGL
ncbi:SusC/RagA family TonB-linked outer membrane protein [Pedobacter deserti]|uniref:SusC/RagA family TonB-linked outer membrane protein n=1 Tax=Pedobacter deserti TaxID=2817382 RepID=UPI00210E1554|nr:TonB-dependent receptor [Pedobacter sp. SYSU D00382]